MLVLFLLGFAFLQRSNVALNGIGLLMLLFLFGVLLPRLLIGNG